MPRTSCEQHVREEAQINATQRRAMSWGWTPDRKKHETCVPIQAFAPFSHNVYEMHAIRRTTANAPRPRGMGGAFVGDFSVSFFESPATSDKPHLDCGSDLHLHRPLLVHKGERMATDYVSRPQSRRLKSAGEHGRKQEYCWADPVLASMRGPPRQKMARKSRGEHAHPTLAALRVSRHSPPQSSKTVQPIMLWGTRK